MPRLHHNDSERVVGMVQAGMTHQAVTGHFNVSRIILVFCVMLNRSLFVLFLGHCINNLILLFVRIAYSQRLLVALPIAVSVLL